MIEITHVENGNFVCLSVRFSTLSTLVHTPERCVCCERASMDSPGECSHCVPIAHWAVEPSSRWSSDVGQQQQQQMTTWNSSSISLYFTFSILHCQSLCVSVCDINIWLCKGHMQNCVPMCCMRWWWLLLLCNSLELRSPRETATAFQFILFSHKSRSSNLKKIPISISKSLSFEPDADSNLESTSRSRVYIYLRIRPITRMRATRFVDQSDPIRSNLRASLNLANGHFGYYYHSSNSPVVLHSIG